MKSKILKIMGIALTLAMVLSLGALMVAPVAAAPDEDAWDTYDLPDAGEDGDYFWDADITAGPGPIARDIDGYFWAYVGIDGADEIVKSLDTEGRAWEVTMYSDADDGVVGGPVVAIACSTEDEDVVYVADATAVYKTEDGGDAWAEVSDIDAADDFGGEDAITCLDVGYVDDEPYVYAGTAGADAAYGEVFYINDVAFGGTWVDLNVAVDINDTDTVQQTQVSDVHGIACSPDFDNDALVAAVVASSDGAVGSFVVVNRGADAGVWSDVEIGTNIVIDEASDPAFVDDFDEDDAYEFFVGVCGDGDATGVYRIDGETDVANIDQLDDIDEVEIISLDLAGDQGNTYLLAGAATVAADVWYSDDDGDNWLQASDEGINPSGEGTYVIADEDIADDGMGWAATVGTGAGIHLTLTGGESWVGISLMDTDAAALVDIGPSPDWASDDTMFVLYTNTANFTEMLRYDGTNWERIWEEAQYAATLGTPCTGDLDLVDCSPGFGDDETLYAAETTDTPEVFISEDGGTVWADTRNVPDSLASWVIIDSDTIIAGGTDSNVYYTDIQGRRAWDDWPVTTAAGQTITSLATSGDTVICGTDGSEVFLSEDFAETWDIVGDFAVEPTAIDATYVGFDTDDITIIYAASDNVVCRYLDTGDTTLDWEVFTLDGAPTEISGLAVADGVIYVSDADEADGIAVNPLGAVQRTVNPLEDVDDVDETEFDFMAEGLGADATPVDDEVFDLLYLSEGSTVLWAVDTDSAIIYTIEDLLAAPATGGEAVPDVDSVGLTWVGFANAINYDVAVYSAEDMGLAYEWFYDPTGDDDPVLNVTDGNTTGINEGAALDAGTQYWWMVRATEPVNSKWSEVWTFTTLPATMTIDADMFGPAVGTTGVPLMPSFGWQDIAEADEYLFELADNPDFTTPIVSTTTTNPVYKLDAALDYETNYFWRVKAVSGTGQSRWATGTFTTMAEAVEAPAPPPAAEAPTITIPTAEEIAPKWIYAIIGIGATLATVVIVLIVRTRKP